ncbi:cell division protein SepF [Bacillus sp. FSL W7-1360]
MSFKSKFKRYFHIEDTSDTADLPEERLSPQQPKRASAVTKEKATSPNVVSLQSAQKTAKMMLIEPLTYDEVQQVADHLKRRKAVVLNVGQIEEDEARRMVDFLSGTVYAIDGDIQKIGPGVFVCTPDNVEVTGSISAFIDNKIE